MDEILVSIDCITYNHEKYIAQAIESFLMQKTNFKYEILIHDDSSTDATQEIIKEYQRRYPDIIKPVLQSENQYSKGIKRISYTFNISRAKGKYIAICEGDDYWSDPYKLQKQVDYMEKNDDCGMCFHAYKVESNGKINKCVRSYKKSKIATVEDIVIGDGDFVATNSILFRKEVMENPPEFYFKCNVGDYPLQILTSMEKYAYYIDEPMSVYRYFSANSWTRRMLSGSDSNKKVISFRENIIEMLKEVNKFTDNIYANAINKKILLFKMDVLLLKNDVDSLKNLKKLNKREYNAIYNNLDLKSRIKYRVKFGMPNLFIFFKNIQVRLRNNL
ncbi:glycosyltransferase [Clostridium tertium]|uniref:Glycosyltransferase n=1 Tax=Clostridium tertium TaxID=1559 RepID=A0A9X4B0L6_9CLOT|nr:glycosyltransferase [Clostridium tertium]MDC4238566.1 glycosyltransferase [Clostridium tertium]